MHAAVAALLGQVHGGFGLTQQLGRVAAVVGDHDQPCTCGQVQGLPIQRQGFANAGQHTLYRIGRRCRCFFQGVAQIAEQQRKRIAVHAGQGLAMAHPLLHASGHGAQYGIAHGHAQRIVDGLEAIQIQGGQGRAAWTAVHGGQLTGHTFQQQPTVGQASQGIEVGQLADFCLGLQALADIADSYRA